ncbi:MAG TPA: flagellar motor switch protein FliM [Rhodanobacteraceae bacterium]|nr:flagellar motor switch protein FliM [Rhodanobacteraceae bacterium]
MAQDELLSQEEIDALLSGPGEAAAAPAGPDAPRIRPYDPASQHRVIRERLHGLDLINQRFARRFRVGLFNLIRRSADITVESMRYQSYRDFVRNVPVPTNLNLVNIKPLRGTALVVFPPNLIYMVVDNLFGGDGRFVTKSEGREFTNTEQRIIRRLLNLALDAYQKCWQAIYSVQVEYVRSEIQAKFANITNSPNEIIVNTTFHIDVGNLSSQFQICIPFSMIEPLRELLANPASGTHEGNGDAAWTEHIAGQLRGSSIEMIAEFVSIPSRIRQVRALKVGDVLPIDLPQAITARVDGVPVLACEYGSHQGQRALRIIELINHAAMDPAAGGAFVKGTVPTTQESDHE